MPTALAHRKGIDYAWFRPHEDEIAGFTDVIRYCAPDGSSTHGKILWRDELEQLLSWGKRVGSVWETSTNRAEQGAQAGKDDARRHIDHLMAIGFKGNTSYWSYDQDGTADKIRAYAEGYHEIAQASPYPRIGAYGPICALIPLFNDGLIALPWQTCSNGFCGGQNGTVWAHTAMKQHCINDNYDTNDIFAEDIGTWNPELGGLFMSLTPEQEQEILAAARVVNSEVKRTEGSVTAYGALTHLMDTPQGKRAFKDTDKIIDLLNQIIAKQEGK